jgi:hypothetical protein
MKSIHFSLKLKLSLVFCILIAILSFAVVFWVRFSFEEYVKNTEINRFRSSVMAVLRIEAKNYCTSMDDSAFVSAIAEVKRIDPSITTAFMTDENGFVAGDNRKDADKILKQIGALKGGIIDDSSSANIDGNDEIIVSYKEELDPYIIHFGFSAKTIADRTNALSRKIYFVVGFTAILAILLGIAFLHVLIAPIEKAAKDAERFSLGDLKIRLQRGSRTESGRIYGSLLRLRESILYSIKRLNM